MSEHHQGKLICVDAGDETEFDLDTSDGWTIASSFRGNARRLAAAWNFCEDMKTETMEQAKKTAFAYMTDSDQHAHKLAQELNSARALLREVIGPKAGDWYTLERRVEAYFDACDKPGAPDAS